MVILKAWFSVDPLAHKSPNQTPYHFVCNNPIMRIDPDRRLDVEIYNLEGKKVGQNNTGKDGIIAFVEKDVEEKLKNGEIGADQAINEGFQTTYTELSEILSVAKRQKTTGGAFEESSVVSEDGQNILHGESGTLSEDGLAAAKLPNMEGDNNTSIHGHPFIYKWDRKTKVGDYWSALEVSDVDKAAFLGYNRNIIVGRLGKTVFNSYRENTMSAEQPVLGAAFYDRNSNYQGQLTLGTIRIVSKKK